MAKMNSHIIPADVPQSIKNEFLKNYQEITKQSGRLMLFAGDQKVEHLNADFYGEGISKDDQDPIHLFNIASKAKIGVFATQIGLISRYGMDFPDVPYLVKLNSKTNLIKEEVSDPISRQWISIDQVMQFKKNSGLNITSVGYTVYLGSIYESKMLKEAAQLIFEAHQQGLVTVIWCYPRGKSVKDEKDPHIIAGAAGVASTLGADFVKVNYPKKEGASSNEALKEAVSAAGRTKVVCAGGSSMDAEKFLQTLHDQIHIAGTMGNATGRNIHQRPLKEAIKFCNAIYSITVENKTVSEALKIYKS